MVFNYKRLNYNIEEDKYPLHNKEALTNKIKYNYIYNKFDLKSGFWQVKMATESRKWRAFITHNSHYEWKVMSFGFKNALQIFQRKIDNIFRNDEFIITNIDVIFIFSKNLKEHIEHLLVFFNKYNQNGLILSEKKDENWV